MIQIVSHCWAKDLPQYAAFLKYQLSSLILYRPTVRTQIVVCYAKEDQATTDVLHAFLTGTPSEDLDLVPFPLSPEELGRRAIGRNKVALTTEADLVWFADVDMVFRASCLDELWVEWMSDPVEYGMLWVDRLMIHRTHELGDQAVEAARRLKYVDINPDDFKPTRYNRAIGGVQIVPGKICRQVGYLPRDKRYQLPRTDGMLFGDFRDDVIFRETLRRKYPRFKALRLSELYRLRHTRNSYQPAEVS